MSTSPTITLSSDDEKEIDNFKEKESKPRPSLPFKRHSLSSKRKTQEDKSEKKPAIEVKVSSGNSQKNNIDFFKIKKKYTVEKKTKKSEVPNVLSHHLFTRKPPKHSVNKSPPALVDLEEELAKMNETESPASGKTKTENEKSINVPGFICNLLSPSKTAIAQKSKILEKEFSSEKKSDSKDKKAFQNPFSSADKGKKPKAMIMLPLKRQTKENQDSCKKDKVTSGQTKVNHVNNKCNKLEDSKDKMEVEVVNLDENDNNKIEAVHENETKMEVEENETKMEVEENENVSDGKRKREEEAEEDKDKDKENIEQTKRPKIEVNAVCEVYLEFVEVAKEAEEDEGDRQKLLKKLNKYYTSAHTSYTMSSEFKQLLQDSIKKIKADKDMLYHMLKDIFENLKSAKEIKGTEKKRVSLQPAKESKVPNGNKESPHKSAKKDEAAEEQPAIDPKTEKIVRKLEKTLRKLEKKIKKLEDAEVDLDDDNDSHYLQMQKFRERFCQVYKKYCEYTGESPNPGGRRKICFSGTAYPAVNKCIERWLNKKKLFPDYAQVLRLIQEQNNVDKLNLTPEGMRTLAEKAFREVGEMLKRIRIYDFNEVMFRVLDEEEDPADKDADLDGILRKNMEESRKKMTELLNYYSERQVNEHYVAEEVPDDEADNSPEESGDEDEKEIEDVENSLLNDESDDNEVTDQNGQPEAEKQEADAVNGTSTTEKGEPDNPNTLKSSSTEATDQVESTPVKESKNNYKHCKSLKWRRENSLKVNSELCNGDDKPVSESDGEVKLNGIITENGESKKDECESAGECKELEKPRTDPVDKQEKKKESKEMSEKEEERKDVSEKEDRKDVSGKEKFTKDVEMKESCRNQEVDCEIIDLDDSPKNNESTYEHLKNELKQQTYFVNYVSVEYSFKNFQERLNDKNRFDRVSHVFPFRDSTNLDKYIYLNDDGYRDLKILKKNKENRSPRRRKGDKTFKMPFRKKIKRGLFVNKCVLGNEENKGIEGDGQGKEDQEEETGSERQEGEEAEENENPAGSNGSGNGEEGDGGEEDKDKKMDEEEEENEEQEEEESQDQEEEDVGEGVQENEKVAESGENGVNGTDQEVSEEGGVNGNLGENEAKEDEEVDEDNCTNREGDIEVPEEKDATEEKEERMDTREECLNGNYDADTDEDNPNENAKESREKESENAIDFDEKLKAFEEALENEEDELHKNDNDERKVVSVKQEKRDESQKEERMKAFEKALEEEEEDTERCEKNVTVKTEPRNEEQETTEESKTNDTDKVNNAMEEDNVKKELIESEEKVTEKPEEEPKNEETPPESEKVEEPADCKENDDKTESEVTNEKTDEEELKQDEESERRNEDEDHDTNAIHEESDAEDEKVKDTDKEDEKKEEAETTEEAKPDEMDTEQTDETNEKEEEPSDLNSDEPGPSKRKLNEEIEVLEFKKSKTVKDPFDEEIVQNFLRQAPSSISITPPKKFLKPPSQEALNALAALKQLPGVSTTRVRRRQNEPDVQVIGESSKKKANNVPISITRIRNPPPQQINRNRGVPVISNVQSMNVMNRSNNLTPKIVTVQGNVSGFHNNANRNVNFGLPMMGRNFNFGVPRMTNNLNNMNMMRMNMNMRIPGLNHFPGFNNQFNNISMFNNRQIQPQPPLKISNVRGNISQTFRPQQQQPQQRRIVIPQANVVRQTVPSSTISSAGSKEKSSKKPVEYVVLD